MRVSRDLKASQLLWCFAFHCTCVCVCERGMVLLYPSAILVSEGKLKVVWKLLFFAGIPLFSSPPFTTMWASSSWSCACRSSSLRLDVRNWLSTWKQHIQHNVIPGKIQDNRCNAIIMENTHDTVTDTNINMHEINIFLYFTDNLVALYGSVINQEAEAQHCTFNGRHGSRWKSLIHILLCSLTRVDVQTHKGQMESFVTCSFLRHVRNQQQSV